MVWSRKRSAKQNGFVENNKIEPILHFGFPQASHQIPCYWLLVLIVWAGSFSDKLSCSYG